MRLLVTELRRFWSRRAIAVVLLLVVVAAALLAASTTWSTRSATEAEVRAAQTQLESEAQQVAADRESCLDNPPQQPTDVPLAERCEKPEPQLDWFLPRQALDLDDQLESSGLVLALVLAGGAIVIGATFAGADWRSGSLTTQLVVRPERVRVWLTKAVAVVVGVALAAFAVVLLFWLSLGYVAWARELDVGGGLLEEVGWQAVRAIVLAMAGALGAYALTMALRSTMTALTLLFAFTVASEALWASLPMMRSSQWALSANVQAWVLDGASIPDDRSCGQPGPACDPTYVLPAAQSALYLGVLLAIAVAVSLVTFKRRDIR